MDFVFKHKKFFVSLFSIIIIALVSLIIYANYISNNDEKDKGSPSGDSSSKYVVVDADLDELKDGRIDYNGTTNKDVVSGDNFIIDDKGNKINKISNLAKDRESNDIIISDLYLTSSVNTPDFCTLMFNFTNNSDMDGNYNLYFRFYDKDGNIMHSFAVNFPYSEKNKKISHTAVTYYPIIDAYDYTVEYFEYD